MLHSFTKKFHSITFLSRKFGTNAWFIFITTSFVVFLIDCYRKEKTTLRIKLNLFKTNTAMHAKKSRPLWEKSNLTLPQLYIVQKNLNEETKGKCKCFSIPLVTFFSLDFNINVWAKFIRANSKAFLVDRQ